MEYLLKLEENKRYWIFGIIITFSVILIMLSGLFFGICGFAACIMLLIFILLTPLIYNRYNLFLFLWLIILPFAEFIFKKNINSSETNPIVLLISLISFPFAMFLLYKNIGLIIKKLPYVLFMVIFGLIILLNIFRPSHHLIDIIQQFKLLFFQIFLISATLFYLKNNPQTNIFKWINIFALSNAIVAIFQKISGIGLGYVDGIYRAPGLINHPNGCGFFINIYMVFAFYMLLNTESKKTKLLYGLCILFNLVALILTFSKTSFFIFSIFLMILLFYLKPKSKLKFISLSCTCGIIFIVLDQTFNLNIIQSIIFRFNSIGSFEWRINMWRLLLNNMDFSSYILGHGVNSSYYYFKTIAPNEYPSAHNSYLILLYEYGVLGFTFILSILYVLFRSVKNYISIKDIKYRTICLVPISISIIFLIEMYAEGSLFMRVASYYGWVLTTIFYLKMESEKESLLRSNIHVKKNS